jgi:hypothetical protein
MNNKTLSIVNNPFKLYNDKTIYFSKMVKNLHFSPTFLPQDGRAAQYFHLVKILFVRLQAFEQYAISIYNKWTIMSLISTGEFQ